MELASPNSRGWHFAARLGRLERRALEGGSCTGITGKRRSKSRRRAEVCRRSAISATGSRVVITQSPALIVGKVFQKLPAVTARAAAPLASQEDFPSAPARQVSVRFYDGW